MGYRFSGSAQEGVMGLLGDETLPPSCVNALVAHMGRRAPTHEGPYRGLDPDRLHLVTLAQNAYGGKPVIEEELIDADVT